MNPTKILENLNKISKDTMMETLDINYIEFTGDTITAEMPVNSKVHQPYGLLHGGASAALAETVGSVLSVLQLDSEKQGAVGVNLNIYHLRSIKEGKIYGKGSFARKGRDLHVINIDIVDEDEKLISQAILTTKIRDISKLKS